MSGMKIPSHVSSKDLTLKEAPLKLGFVSEPLAIPTPCFKVTGM